MVLKNFISRFNSDDFDFLKAFYIDEDEEEWDVIRKFFRLLENRNLIQYIRVGNKDFMVSYTQNLFDRWCFRRPELRNEFIHFAAGCLYRDVEYRDGRIFLILSHLDLLSNLFDPNDGGRNGISSYDLAYGILSEDSYEPYPDTTNDVYGDVISVLTKPNFKKLCQLITQGREPIVISDYSHKIHSTLIPQLAVEQGNENVLNFDEVVVETMLRDEDTFKFLCREVISDDFYYSLIHCHGNAYNGVLVDGWYNEVWSELRSFGIGEGVWTKKETGKNIYEIDITDNFLELLGEFLDVNQGYRVSISDFTNYFSFIEYGIEDKKEGLLMRLRLDEYPDRRKVEEYINDSIFDYVEL